MAHLQYPVIDNVRTISPNTCAELSLFVQADHNYSLPVIKEEEFIIDDDLKVVEITEEVDVSMHVGENGTTYLEDTNGVQWNIENPNLFRLNDLPWKPLENIVKTDQEEERVNNAEYVNNVKIVKNCINCQAPLSSGALCVKCNQPWVSLTDIFKTKDFARYKQRRDMPDLKERRFYILKKSDVGKFVNKNMGRLNVINQYEARNFSNMNLGNDVKRKDVTKGNNMGEVSTTKQNYVTTNQNIIEHMKNVINESNKEKIVHKSNLGNDVKRKEVTKGNNMGEVNTTKHNYVTTNQNIIEHMKNVINQSNKEKIVHKSNNSAEANPSRRSVLKKNYIDEINNAKIMNTMKVSSSNQDVLIKISTPTYKKKQHRPKPKERNLKFNFIKKYVSVDIDSLNHTLIVRDEVVVPDNNIEDRSKEVTKISDINPYHKTGNVKDDDDDNGDYEDNKIFINVRENEDTEMDDVEDTSGKRSCTKRENKSGNIKDDDNEDNKMFIIVRENEDTEMDDVKDTSGKRSCTKRKNKTGNVKDDDDYEDNEMFINVRENEATAMDDVKGTSGKRSCTKRKNKTGNVKDDDDYEDNEMFINVRENEDSEMDDVEDTSGKRSCTKRKSALNHKFLHKEKGILMDILDNEERETEKEEVVVKVKPRKIAKKKYSCIACDTMFFTYNKLHKHMKAHKEPFGCIKCKVKLVSDMELIAHSVVHNILSSKQLKCKLCDKELKTLDKLRLHSYIHVKSKTFSCEKCDASFNTPSKLKIHKIKHGTLPFSCTLCNRQFKRSGYLRRHYCPKRWNLQKKSE